MYSAPGAFWRSQARYTASTEKKSLGLEVVDMPCDEAEKGLREVWRMLGR